MRGLSFGELLDYSAEESNHWRDFFKQHPEAMDLPCDIAQTKILYPDLLYVTNTVWELVLHVVIVQMRYAERLLNMPVTEYESLISQLTGAKPGEEKPGKEQIAERIFALGRKSLEDLRSFAIAANDPDWDGTLTFVTRSAGEFTASRRKIFIHALLHGVRHWAQLSTYLRQKGYKHWQHDFIFSAVIK